MFRNEHEDGYNEHANLFELIEQFEKCLQNNEQGYFDDDALEQILEYYESRMDSLKLEKAVDYAIQLNPYSSDFIIRKAELFLQKKKYQDAHEWLDKAMLYDRNDIDIYLIRADVFMETEKLKEALQTLEESLLFADETDKSFVYLEMSHVFELEEDYEKAFECLTQALEFNSEHIDILQNISHIVDMTDKFDESISIHKKILDSNPYNWLAWYNLGRAYAGMNLYEKASEAYEFCSAIQDDFEYAYREAADVCFRMDNYEKAIELFLLAQNQSPEFDDYSFRIGFCFEKLDNYKSARFHYRKTTRTDPYHDEAFFRIGETYRIEERYEAAIVNYKKALKLDTQNEYYLSTIIAIYQVLENESEVIEHYYKLVYARPDVITFWIEFIQYTYTNGYLDEAEAICSEATFLCGNFSEFLYLHSLVLFKLGKEKEAFSKLENALTKDFMRHAILQETDESFYLHHRVQRLIELYRK